MVMVMITPLGFPWKEDKSILTDRGALKETRKSLLKIVAMSPYRKDFFSVSVLIKDLKFFHDFIKYEKIQISKYSLIN